MKFNHANGFSMIEVLVAIVVISIGMLGMAALHTVTLRNTNNSYYHSIAVNLAQDMADRMRSNATQFAAYAGNSSTSAPANPTTSTAGNICPEGLVNNAYVSNCTGAQIAAYDFFHFWTDVKNLLPNGMAVTCSTATPNEAAPNPTISVNCGGGAPNVVAVKIYWKEDKNNLANWYMYSVVVRL